MGQVEEVIFSLALLVVGRKQREADLAILILFSQLGLPTLVQYK